MNKLGLALFAAFLGLAPAQALAQNAGWPPPAGAIAFLCVYNTVLPTLINGQVGYAQCDSSGRVITTISSATANNNIAQWAGVTLGAPSNYGTSPGAVTVPGFNAFVTNTVPVTGTFFQATQPVSATSLPLPTGAATQATLAAILTQLAYGQALMAASLPVTIASNQSPLPVTGTFFQATQPVSIAAAPLQPLGITPTDHTITSATGSSQTVMALNANRHSLNIVNSGNANCGINPTGGTAAIGGPGTLTLQPGGAYTPRVPTLSAVTAICTSGQPLYADDN